MIFDSAGRVLFKCSNIYFFCRINHCGSLCLLAFLCCCYQTFGVKKHAFPDVSSWKASSDLTGNGNRHLLSYDV